MATAKGKTDRQGKTAQGIKSVTASVRAKDAAVRSVIPDDVLRNLNASERRSDGSPSRAGSARSRFAC